MFKHLKYLLFVLFAVVMVGGVTDTYCATVEVNSKEYTLPDTYGCYYMVRELVGYSDRFVVVASDLPFIHKLEGGYHYYKSAGNIAIREWFYKNGTYGGGYGPTTTPNTWIGGHYGGGDYNGTILASNFDVKNEDGTIFFRRPAVFLKGVKELPAGLKMNLKKILPIAVSCLGLLIGLVVLRKKLRSFLRV